MGNTDGPDIDQIRAGVGKARHVQEAVTVTMDCKCSTGYMQRKLAIGCSKAAPLFEQVEEQGVVGPGEPRRQARSAGAEA
jgi:DNA segregation ATPase FtsK/SpoIIIE-like protein